VAESIPIRPLEFLRRLLSSPQPVAARAPSLSAAIGVNLRLVGFMTPHPSKPPAQWKPTPCTWEEENIPTAKRTPEVIEKTQRRSGSLCFSRSAKPEAAQREHQEDFTSSAVQQTGLKDSGAMLRRPARCTWWRENIPTAKRTPEVIEKTQRRSGSVGSRPAEIPGRLPGPHRLTDCASRLSAILRFTD
jgi:hypothetical protein